ncbi:PREDICTED: acyl carrier protein 2, mitochondrial-like isoform X1 [Nicotiana attenuata]|uniref:acyl carrier protein 2, mitochondrial-like isoform X1 n=1 Tax=Nicotiana attenuata TaxID=49451 RepID=UPI0009053FBD|nr:PREDICTED: acyl carrier protein 2, mitochondrial-like isoform X1 [Nicotiana attenuata]
MAARNALLKYMRVEARLPQLQNPRLIGGSFTQLFKRHFSEEVRGSFLDKSEVADRVINCVKNFPKLDPSKLLRACRSKTRSVGTYSSKRTVTPNAHFQNDLGLDSLDTVEIVMALEEEFAFEIPDNEADKISSINLAVDFIASHPQAK